MKLFSPSRAEYHQIFSTVAREYGLTLEDDVFDFVVEQLVRDFGLAYYQPKFICEQVVGACGLGLPPHMTIERVSDALANLYFDIEDGQNNAATS